MQSSIMSVFRLPLNLLVVIGTKLTDNTNNDKNALKFVFVVLIGMHVIATLLQIMLQVSDNKNIKKD